MSDPSELLTLINFWAGPKGFEPSTAWLKVRRSTRLSYGPRNNIWVPRAGFEPATCGSTVRRSTSLNYRGNISGGPAQIRTGVSGSQIPKDDQATPQAHLTIIIWTYLFIKVTQAPGGIRTPDHLITSQALYQAEPPRQFVRILNNSIIIYKAFGSSSW